MDTLDGSASIRNTGKQPYLPPKSPLPFTLTPVCEDYGSIGSRAVSKRDGQRQHQRTSSESFLIEEQPFWLDDLLNEPDTPVKRTSHHRSSSDSLAYMDGARAYSAFNTLGQEDCLQRLNKSLPLWGSQEFDLFKDFQPYYARENSFSTPCDKVWMSGINAGCSKSDSFLKERVMHQESSRSTSKRIETLSLCADEKPDKESPKDSKRLLEKKDASLSNYTQVEADSRRAKQQFAQRSRVRKIQYISELERNVQALQAEGLEVSAELGFVDQQNLILSLENKVLKQRLDSLAQEQLIKHFEHEMLEREIGRLGALFQQQQQQPPLLPLLSHGHSGNSSRRDFDSTVGHKVVKCGRDPIPGLRI